MIENVENVRILLTYLEIIVADPSVGEVDTDWSVFPELYLILSSEMDRADEMIACLACLEVDSGAGVLTVYRSRR